VKVSVKRPRITTLLASYWWQSSGRRHRDAFWSDSCKRPGGTQDSQGRFALHPEPAQSGSPGLLSARM